MGMYKKICSIKVYHLKSKMGISYLILYMDDTTFLYLLKIK